MKLPKFMLVCATAACLGAYSTTPAQAAPITINNYSFENATGYGAQKSGVSSWTADQHTAAPTSSNADVINATANGYSGADGSNVMMLNLDVGSTVTLAAATSWVSSVSLGNFAASTSYTLTVGVGMQGGRQAARSAVIAFGTNGTLASVVTSQAIAVSSLTSTLQNITLTLDTSVFSGLVNQNIVVFLEQYAPAGLQYGNSVAFDNVRLDTLAVPEPTTWALLAFSLTSVVVFRRRRNS